MESIDFILSVLFAATRMIRLLLISAVHVGRVDTPLLAKGVGDLGPLKFDDTPDMYMKSVLVQEAHR